MLMMPLSLMDLLLGTGPESTLFHTEKVNVIVIVIVTVNVSCLSSVIMFIVLFFVFVTGV